MNTHAHLDIRKYRKKLKQIDNLLSLNRPLVDEETFKVSQKATLLDKLQALLRLDVSQSDPDSQELLHDKVMDEKPMNFYDHHPLSSQSTVDESNKLFPEIVDKISRNELGYSSSPLFEKEVILQKEDNTTEAAMDPSDIIDIYGSSKKGVKSIEKISEVSETKETLRSNMHDSKINEITKSGKDSRNEELNNQRSRGIPFFGRCDVHVLEQIGSFTCIDLNEDWIATGGASTTVSVYDSNSCDLFVTLSGHRDVVSSVCLLGGDNQQTLGKVAKTPEPLVISASLDCTVRLWGLDTGRELSNLYLYSPVKCVKFGFGPCHLLVASTESGKLFVWKPDVENDLLFSLKLTLQCGNCSLNSLDTHGDCLITGSEDGTVRKYVLKTSDTGTVSEELMMQFSPDGVDRLWQGVLDMSALKNDVIVADGGVNVKICSEGNLKKLRNHASAIGRTSSVAVCSLHPETALDVTASDWFLVATGFDVDFDCSYINVWSHYDNRYHYHISLREPGHDRFLTVDCRWHKRTLRIVTAGSCLKLWDLHLTSARGHKTFSLPLEFNLIYTKSPILTDSESDEDEDEVPSPSRAPVADAADSWRFCVLL